MAGTFLPKLDLDRRSLSQRSADGDGEPVGYNSFRATVNWTDDPRRQSMLPKIYSRSNQMSDSRSGLKLRRSLPLIETYQQVLKFPVEASQRVLLNLERLMGSTTIRPMNPTYLKTLRGKLDSEETQEWQERARIRKKEEYNRCRKLVIDGHSDPLPGMEHLYKHPVFRVNRMMSRLSKLDEWTQGEFHLKPPPIVPVEPFEEYATTGLLFGSHPSHHLKVTRRVSKELPESPEEELEIVRKPSEAVIRDLEAAKKRYGINPDDIEKMWKSYESPLIQMITAEESSDGLFDMSNKVINTMKREHKFSNDFPHRTYTRLVGKTLKK